LPSGRLMPWQQLYAADYVIDRRASDAFINFKIAISGYSWLYGRFNDFDGTSGWDADKPEQLQSA